MSLQNRTGLTSQAPPPVQRRLGLALLVIATAELMLVLDDTIVNVALPSMQRSLHLATSHLNWVISFYALAFGGLMLAGGRAGDLFGRLKVFRLGIAVFTLASLAGGFAPNGRGADRRPRRPGVRRRASPRPARCPCWPPRSRLGRPGPGRSASTARWAASARWSACCSAARSPST